MSQSDEELLKSHADIFESTTANVLRMILNLAVRFSNKTAVLSLDSIGQLNGCGWPITRILAGLRPSGSSGKCATFFNGKNIH